MKNNVVALKYLDINADLQSTDISIPSELKQFLNKIKKINKLPLSIDICYSDDLWDFAPFKKTNVPNSSLRFNFNSICDVYKEHAKDYVLFLLINNKIKINTINAKYRHARDFLNYTKEQNYYNIGDIDYGLIKKYIDNRAQNIQIPQIQLIKNNIKEFLQFYSLISDYQIPEDAMIMLSDPNTKAVEAVQKENKTKDIPDSYYNNFLSGIIRILDDESCDKDLRTTAAVFLILSQTGLRIGECLALEQNTLRSVTISNGETAYYLKYRTWKRERGNNKSTWNEIYINEFSKKGYDFLLDIYKERRIKENTNYLYLGGNKVKNYPLSINSFVLPPINLFIYLNNFFPTINIPENTYTGIENVSLKGRRSSYIKPDHKTVAMPKCHQFRVHMCTELYNKGVPLKYIEKFMSHLSAEMADYYVRPTKQNPQENMNFSMDTLKKIVSGETKLLGGNQGLIDKINEFIAKNEYNVETDLQTICEKLAEQIPIRQKTGGVCIKSSMLRECSKDSKTNEFYCAYGVCPNIFHFYYMANVSYRQTKELMETIAINEKRGLLKQVQKEKNMLHHIIKVKLLPELDELKNVLEKKGFEAVVTEYPDLKDIVENLDNIYKEIEIWSK